MIFYFNPDVSGGIEYVGNEIEKWIENKSSIYVSKKQHHHFFHTKDLVSIKPKIIILNELFENIMLSVYHYKTCFPSTKIIAIVHDWVQIKLAFENKNNTTNELIYREFFKICDQIIVLNYCNEEKIIQTYLPDKISFMTFPVDPEVYKITTPWKERKKKFVYLGTIIPLKFSEEFIQILYKENIQMDVYGYKFPGYEFKDYNRIFDKCSNIDYYGKINQDEVPGILNKYKYYILPHTGSELFNISLKHAISCGTIPIILRENDFSNWLNWANGLFYSCSSMEDFVNNIKQLMIEDVEDQSNYISNEIKLRYPYENMKEQILNIIGGFL